MYWFHYLQCYIQSKAQLSLLWNITNWYQHSDSWTCIWRQAVLRSSKNMLDPSYHYSHSLLAQTSASAVNINIAFELYVVHCWVHFCLFLLYHGHQLKKAFHRLLPICILDLGKHEILQHIDGLAYFPFSIPTTQATDHQKMKLSIQRATDVQALFPQTLQLWFV